MARDHSNATAYPLAWPEGWPPTPAHLRREGWQFMRPGGEFSRRSLPTIEQSRRLLASELVRLKAGNIVISMNVKLRSDGAPYSDGYRASADPGVAVYFLLKGKPTVMAQDAFTHPAANMRSLTLAIVALRSLERHGGGRMMEKAFEGFAALPPPEGHTPKRPWWEVMRYSADPAERELLSAGEVNARFNNLAKKLHPDVPGGSTAAMAELNQARADALADLGAGDESSA